MSDDTPQSSSENLSDSDESSSESYASSDSFEGGLPSSESGWDSYSDDPVMDEHFWDDRDHDHDGKPSEKQYVNPELVQALHSVKAPNATLAELYRATSPQKLQTHERSPYDDGVDTNDQSSHS